MGPVNLFQTFESISCVYGASMDFLLTFGGIFVVMLVIATGFAQACRPLVALATYVLSPFAAWYGAPVVWNLAIWICVEEGDFVGKLYSPYYHCFAG